MSVNYKHLMKAHTDHLKWTLLPIGEIGAVRDGPQLCCEAARGQICGRKNNSSDVSFENK
jgi:hypothetical protein